MRKVCVIPARLNSTRFPKKILAELQGKSLLQWTYEAAKKCPFDEIVVAVDAEETLDLVRSFGAKAILTCKNCSSGTMRIAELVERGKISGDVIINWQADEPLITPKMIEDLLQGRGDVWTLKKRIRKKEQITDPNKVKVVTDRQGHALYFSRCPIPHNGSTFFQHLGIYAYTEETLRKLAHFPPSSLEKAEHLEQLRFLENGLKICVNKTDGEALGIDTKNDFIKLEKIYATLWGS
ncbi:MAG: 3-deoxy-manno-octulosonate cytidylyltransferase [Candidatus Algichlamydia australiensis]|nr:3-deoxy-manno-octulosonate cytidylyltransferase [Chlamydiales bacterium]